MGLGPEWLDASEAAEYLGLSPGAIYGLSAKGELRTTGWPIRVHRVDLDAYIQRCRIKRGQLAHLNQYPLRDVPATQPTSGTSQHGTP